MIQHKLEFVIEEISSAQLAAQGLLQAYTGKVVPKSEAQRVWQRIPDHKWYLSERLGRDVGTRVAAVDFIENFYEPAKKTRRSDRWSTFPGKVLGRIGSWITTYFTANVGLKP